MRGLLDLPHVARGGPTDPERLLILRTLIDRVAIWPRERLPSSSARMVAHYLKGEPAADFITHGETYLASENAQGKECEGPGAKGASWPPGPAPPRRRHQRRCAPPGQTNAGYRRHGVLRRQSVVFVCESMSAGRSQAMNGYCIRCVVSKRRAIGRLPAMQLSGHGPSYRANAGIGGAVTLPLRTQRQGSSSAVTR